MAQAALAEGHALREHQRLGHGRGSGSGTASTSGSSASTSTSASASSTLEGVVGGAGVVLRDVDGFEDGRIVGEANGLADGRNVGWLVGVRVATTVVTDEVSTVTGVPRSVLALVTNSVDVKVVDMEVA